MYVWIERLELSIPASQTQCVNQLHHIQILRALDASGRNCAGYEGFEPTTNRLTVYCSTTELIPHITHTAFNLIPLLRSCFLYEFVDRGRLELPARSSSSVYPTSWVIDPFIVAGAGLEPASFSLWDWAGTSSSPPHNIFFLEEMKINFCSNMSKILLWASCRTRTYDRLITNEMLYQLS